MKQVFEACHKELSRGQDLGRKSGVARQAGNLPFIKGQFKNHFQFYRQSLKLCKKNQLV